MSSDVSFCLATLKTQDLLLNSYIGITVKLLNIWKLEKFAVITLKSEQGGFTVEYVSKRWTELQTV